MSDIKADIARVSAEGKANGLLQAQVIALEAARMYPNHRFVAQLIAERIGAAIPEPLAAHTHGAPTTSQDQGEKK